MAGAGAQQVQPRSNPPRLVNDFAGIIPAGQEESLEKQLVDFDNATSNQIAVITVQSLDNYDVADVAIKYLREWGVGNKNNNGVVLLVAPNERKVRIETGYGLEGALPDITANQIIEGNILPKFKAGDFSGGILAGVEAIEQATKGEYTAPKGYNKRGKRGSSGSSIIIFIVIFIIIIFASSRGGGRNGGMMSRRGYRNIGGSPIWWLPTGGGGGGGGDWGGGGGGGFGGFGGGSGGGGGASGSW